jgi:hypothetical protein
MDFNVFYLTDESLIKLTRAIGIPWINAQITAFGIDVVEDKDRFKTTAQTASSASASIAG